MSREILQRALDALDYEFENELFRTLLKDIRAELQKPELVECGRIVVQKDVFMNRWKLDTITDGKYRLLAEKIDD